MSNQSAQFLVQPYPLPAFGRRQAGRRFCPLSAPAKCSASGSNDDIIISAGSSKIGQIVRRTGAQSAPDFDQFEDFAVPGTHRGCSQDHLVVYVHSWIDVEAAAIWATILAQLFAKIRLCKSFYFYIIRLLHGLPKVILCLLDQPAFGTTAKGLRKPDSHFR